MGVDVDDIDWEGIKQELNAIGEPFEDDCGNKVKAIFLGSVFSLTPSGKYYTPFACSNVNEKEAREDQEWWEALEKKASEHGLYISSGEGDPTDIVVGMTVNEAPDGKACLVPQMKPGVKKNG